MDRIENLDETRLLSKEEIDALDDEFSDDEMGSYMQEDKLIKAQDAKTASIKDTEIKRLKEDHEIKRQMLGEVFRDKCQQRVERIFKEIEKQAFLRLEVNAVDEKIHPVRHMNILEKEWQTLKKQEGIA